MSTNDIGNTGGLKPGSVARARARQDARRAGAGADRGGRLYELGEALLSAERAGEPLPRLTDGDLGEILDGNIGTLDLSSLLRAKAKQQVRRSGGAVGELQLSGRPKSGAALLALVGAGDDAQALRRQLVAGSPTGTARGLGRL